MVNNRHKNIGSLFQDYANALRLFNKVGFNINLKEPTITNASYTSLVFGDGKFIAIKKSSEYIYSYDGFSWAESHFPIDFDSISNIIWGNGIFAVGCDSQILYSEDGINWKYAILPDIENNIVSTIIYSSEKDMYIATINKFDKFLYSYDGINWSLSNKFVTSTNADEEMIKKNEWVSIDYGNGRFVAIAPDKQYSIVSVNGIDWTLSVRGELLNLYYKKIIYYPQRECFLALCGSQKDTFQITQDGLNWIPIKCNTLKNKTYKTAYIVDNNLLLHSTSSSYVYGLTSLNIKSVQNKDATSTWKSLSGDCYRKNGFVPIDIAYGNNTYVGINSNGKVFVKTGSDYWAFIWMEVNKKKEHDDDLIIADQIDSIIKGLYMQYIEKYIKKISFKKIEDNNTKQNLKQVIYNKYNHMFYCILKDTSNIIIRGKQNDDIEDITWETFELPKSCNWSSIAYDENTIVVSSSDYSICAISKDNGETWEEKTLPRPSTQIVCAKDKKFNTSFWISINDSYSNILFSYNDFNWIGRNMPNSDMRPTSICIWNYNILIGGYYYTSQKGFVIKDSIVDSFTSNLKYTEFNDTEFNSPIISIIRDNKNSIIILTENDIYIHPFYFGEVVYKPMKIEVPFNPYIIDYNNGIFVIVDKSSNLYFSIDNGCTWRKSKKINLPNISHITHDDKERFVILNNEPLSKDSSNNGIYFLY